MTRSQIGQNSDILHLCYIGDAQIGDRSSVGAGSLTVNFDGNAHQKTRLGNDVFLGSRTTLVAPLSVGDGQKVAANETITGRLKPAPVNNEANAASPGTTESGSKKKAKTAASKRKTGSAKK